VFTSFQLAIFHQIPLDNSKKQKNDKFINQKVVAKKRKFSKNSVAGIATLRLNNC